MTSKNKKQFGVWMDTQHATIVGRESGDAGPFTIIAHETLETHENSNSESVNNNSERTSLLKMFKHITKHMQNIDEIHVTGTGTVQEQFIRHLSETPQYKNAIANESTSTRMTDAALIEYVTAHFGQHGDKHQMGQNK